MDRDVCVVCARMRRRRGRQAGVGLVEVMVAVLLMSLGVLGVGALQARALSSNSRAMARSLAMLSVGSMLDGMRADEANARAGAYVATVNADACPAGGTPDTPQARLQAWCQALADALGAVAGITGRIVCSPVSSGSADCTVAVHLPARGAGPGATGPAQTVSIRTLL